MGKSGIRYGIAIIVALAAVGISALAAQDSYYRGPLPALVWTSVVAFTIQWAAYVHSWVRQTERFYDLIGSLTYVTIVVGALTLSPTRDPRTWVVAVCVTIWALRLGPFLYARIRRDGHDSRFAKILPDPGRLFLVWTMQGLWVTLTSLAAMIVITARGSVPMGWTAYLGIVLWAVGLGLEVTADLQKRRFKADANNRGEFIRTGLWAYSRHPNYFGEITLWVGVFVIAAEALAGWQYLVIISPIFVTVLLTRISGIPMLEKKADERWGQRQDYQQYKAATPVLIPRPGQTR